MLKETLTRSATQPRSSSARRSRHRLRPLLGYRDRVLLGVLLYFVGALVLRAALAQGTAAASTPPDLDELGAGALLMQTDAGEWIVAPTLDTVVSASISGIMARVDVSQQFRNSSDHWIEAIYAFPLPDDAAVDRMVLTIGDRRIEGRIEEKAQALATYRAARAAGRTASLVTQQRPNLFTTRAANIGPGEEVEVSLSYVQSIDYRDGRFAFRFPMTLAPRYAGEAPGARAGLHAEEVDPDMSRAQQAGGHLNDPMISLDLKLYPGFDLVRLESRYHDIDLIEAGGAYRVQLAGGMTAAERDFELVWEPALADAPQAAVFAETRDDGEYLLLMLMPPQAKAAQALPRELILVIDTSGSMHGESLDRARESLAMALGTLHPDDRFNLIEFNSTASALFAAPVHADDDALLQASEWIDALAADGGTDMAPALELAFAGQAPQGYLRQVVFVTDGSVGNEVELFRLIEASLGEARLFTVGIGAAPNTYFMRRAAQFGRGSSVLIGSAGEVTEKMDRLLRRLESPALSALCLDFGGSAERYPERLPDLYLGEPLVISARVDDLRGQAELCGESAHGAWAKKQALAGAELGEGIATLWARRKIADLMDELALGGDATMVREKVLDVALAHRLVSRYTAFVAVDQTPGRSQQAALARARVRNLAPRPAGAAPAPAPSLIAADSLAVALPHTAAGVWERLVFGLALLALGWTFGLRLRGDAC